MERPVAIAWTPDGRLLVTEQTGDIRLAEGGRLRSKPWASIADVRVINESGLVGIATDPDFATNHFMYVAYTGLARNVNEAPRLVLLRLQERAGAAGVERKRLLDVSLASGGDVGMLHFGPGGALYIAVRIPGPLPAQLAGSQPEGRILRVAADALASVNGGAAGATAKDAQVYALGFADPRDFSVEGTTGAMYVLDRGVNNDDEVRLIPSSATGRGAQQGLAAEAPLRPLTTVRTYPPSSGGGGIAAYDGGRLAAFTGDLLVCSGAHLRRLRLGEDRRTVVDDQPIAPFCSG
ncbi:MAG: PQQ-dependent sugar dehydrogenase, partial [Dehalococcoidia bacterium]